MVASTQIMSNQSSGVCPRRCQRRRPRLELPPQLGTHGEKPHEPRKREPGDYRKGPNAPKGPPRPVAGCPPLALVSPE
jgi:hypothetical protein